MTALFSVLTFLNVVIVSILSCSQGHNSLQSLALQVLSRCVTDTSYYTNTETLTSVDLWLNSAPFTEAKRKNRGEHTIELSTPDDLNLSMMKHTHSWCQASPSITFGVKPSSSHSLRIRRGLRLKRAKGQDAQGAPGKGQPSQCRDEILYSKMTMPPTIVIKRQEMASFFRLLDDDLIHDFLWMDCCCKLTDKYLLAMTFVYFKRARFTIAEYTRKNFFIALYLANTMEEDEEESKYEIFPWALGKNWRKQFPCFLKQRDKLWARVEYRAAVSRRCCEEVMAIVSSHFVWQRERSEHHSGAQRQYGDRGQTRIPRGPSASPVSCALCNRGTEIDQGLGASSPSKGSAQTPNAAFSHPFTSALSLEITPPRVAASRRKAVKAKDQAQHSFCCCAEEVPRVESSRGSTYDTSMDWISEE